jgi:putative peptide zinc metalloprotease protein
VGGEIVPVDRPTFHESWYRVADLRPRLRAAVQTCRQHYRGRLWYVVRDPANNQFFRLHDAAYHFIALLNGRRTVAQAWQACNDQLGDAAPTQGEVIQLLGQMYASNLLHADLPPDATGMFERYRKRVRREVGSYLSNFLFIRLPLFDPEWILERWVGVVGWMFGPIGFVLWAILLATAGVLLVGRADELLSQGASLLTRENLLKPENALLLAASFWVIKAIHEFGHGFACKRFGVSGGSGGEVHTMGIMLLVLMPVPYVDASSSWAFRSKWQRAFVGAAGMYVELAAASVAAIVWALTGPGLVHDIAYNILFIASVSTLLFNGNPLLRYDGYYILSDLLEIPNLYQRSKEYLYYFVKRYAYGVRRPRNPADTQAERILLPAYGLASFAYRIIICVGILLFIADKLLMLGLVLAVAAIVTWVFVPMGRFAHYLATSAELSRTRGRALAITAGVIGAVVLFVGAVKMPDRSRAQGVVEPVRMAVIHMQENGFVDRVLPSGASVDPRGDPLLVADNEALVAERRRIEAQIHRAEAQHRHALGRDLAEAQALADQLATLNEQLDRVQQRLASLELRAPFEGTWVSPQSEQVRGAYLQRGQALGIVASLDEVIVRVSTDQRLGPRLLSELQSGATAEMRIEGRPDTQLTGQVERIARAGTRQLPSPALAITAGGSIAVEPDEQRGDVAAEPVFEIRLRPDANGSSRSKLLPGQRVVVRFELASRPLAAQWWQSLRQLLQRRFQI